MGDSACVMHGFSYASAFPNESKLGNPMHALGDSISFGRFMTESLSWEKWSTFSHKKYVEEAERYAQPGSVAQKKAFFEAHYKRIAARKAAALLEQENAANITEDEGVEDYNAYDEKRVILNSHPDVDVKMVEVKIQEGTKEDNVVDVNGHRLVAAVDIGKEGERAAIPETEASNDNLSSLKTSIQNKPSKIPSSPAKPVAHHPKEKESNVPQSTTNSSVDKKAASPNSLLSLMNVVPIQVPDKEPVSAIKTTDISGLACSTPLRTPLVLQAASKGESTYPGATPVSESRRTKTTIDPSAPGSKRTGPKWHVLSAVCSKSLTACRRKLQTPTSSTPVILRTEERPAKGNQKLEEKSNASTVQKMQIQETSKAKAGKKFTKLSCVFCFRTCPLPDFDKEREAPETRMDKTPAAQPESAVLRRSGSDKRQGTISMLPPPPPPTCLAKNSTPKNLSRKNVHNLSKFPANSLPDGITHENASPNIPQ